MDKNRDHCQNVPQWFETRAFEEDVPDLIKQFSRGLNLFAKRYAGYLINLCIFHISQHDARCKTKNSGVKLVASTTSFEGYKNSITENLSYYGRIVDTVELHYYCYFKIVLFNCDWYKVEKDNYGLTYVYFNKRCSQEEPFVLASQVHQCFYEQDPYDQDTHYVVKTVMRDLFKMTDEFKFNLPQNYENELSEHLTGPSILEDVGEVPLVRTDVPETAIHVPSKEFDTKQHEVEYEKEFEDESEEVFVDKFEEEFEDGCENDSEDDSKDDSENEYKDDFEDD
ncbi:hypothetical protein EJD97_006638, partial [Solanum chilense]